MRRLRAATALSVAFALSACGSSARTSGPYRAKAAHAVEAVASAVSSDLLVLRAVRRGSAAAPFVSVATSQAEDDASSASSTFLSVQPPTRGDERVRHELGEAFDAALGDLGDARIAGRRGDKHRLLALRTHLEVIARRLHDIESSLA
jgi:hypothetical protein